MIIKLCLALFAPLAIGFLLVHIFLPFKNKGFEHFLLKGSLAPGLGFGITSCIYFFCLVLFGPTIIGMIFLEAVMVILLMSVSFYIGRRRTCFEYGIAHQKVLSDLKLSRILSFGFYIILVCVFANFVALEIHTPHGAWDSWAIWNLRARFIFRGGEYWRDAFSSLLLSFQHTDYPLLIPLSVSRLWTYVGKETQVAPILIAFFFTFAVVGIIYSALAVLRSKSQGFLGGIFLLSTTIFVFLGAYQYADIPISSFFLASLTLLLFQERSPENYTFSLFSGVMAGLSGWTKNEGLLFILCLFLVCFSLAVFSSCRKENIKRLAYLAMGSIPFLIMIIYFKVYLAPPNDIVSREIVLGQVIDKLSDYSRYVTILKTFITYALFYLPSVLLLAVYALLFGIRIDDTFKASIVLSLLVIVLMISGYFLVYLITPYDLNWHLKNSLPRLFAQLWPSILLTYFMIIRTPEEMLESREQ